ncbi:hypothetical protein LOK49_LG15G00358 [Camellia lanceoleosa]|uniref:Uncharacterized protein n=1 Tax=Camellia lanceoleosa TaxID=1840588 RepID=A0ACC0F862_9ERIC|nr:hypothetical protein LOK49_LG15G00358 [Camellia lanceoleosa]
MPLLYARLDLCSSNEIAPNNTQSNASESTLFLSSLCDRDQHASIPLFRFDSVTKGMEEVSSSSQSVELLEHNEGNIENQLEKTSNVEEKVEDPKVGMLFDSIDELVEFYKLYGKAKGFGVSIRTSKKGTDGKVRCEMVMAWIHKLNGELKEAEDVCGTNKPISGGQVMNWQSFEFMG